MSVQFYEILITFKKIKMHNTSSPIAVGKDFIMYS